MSYDAVVFDNDGVLVGRTSYNVLREAAETTFKQFGVTDPDPEHIETMAAGVDPSDIDEICNAYDLNPDQLWEIRDRAGTLAQRTEVHEGRKTLYDDLHVLDDLNLDYGVVSSNQQATVEFVLDHYGVSDRFGAVYGREPTLESLRRRKPNPYYLHRALEDLGTTNALFVGDNESDIHAANNAGIDSAFIRRPHREDWYLNVEPTHDIDGLDDLHDICAP
ncbi:HAD family hydrolase [Salarchaeum sp. III]|uniref:HAD family hydrolase n=1 Tax=Salarchaeum sp. III TaxID=3107927 RepID=UPI002EDAE3C3